MAAVGVVVVAVVVMVITAVVVVDVVVIDDVVVVDDEVVTVTSIHVVGRVLTIPLQKKSLSYKIGNPLLRRVSYRYSLHRSLTILSYGITFSGDTFLIP